MAPWPSERICFPVPKLFNSHVPRQIRSSTKCSTPFVHSGVPSWRHEMSAGKTWKKSPVVSIHHPSRIRRRSELSCETAAAISPRSLSPVYSNASPLRSPLPTILDVAAAAEVSTATVSRVLSNPEKVTETTRRRVLKAVRQLGYSPNAAAKSLRTLSTRKLLVTVPDIANPFFSLIIQGIEEAALREGYAVVLGDTHHDPAREERYGEMLLRREADGLIFLGHSLSKAARALMQPRRKGRLAPIVNGCEYSPGLGVPSAHVDNLAAAREAMEHLYGLGHRHIGVITGPLVSPLSRDRLRGVNECARKYRRDL